MIAAAIAAPLAYDALPTSPRLADWIAVGRYHGYAYAYPHKTAYRPLPAPIPVEHLWRDEPKDSVALYLHVPFCEFRCGFCNLFTTLGAREDADAFVAALERQSRSVHERVDATIATVAIGGGTPTWLSVPLLERTLRIVRAWTTPESIPFTVETSPATATADRLAVLRDAGVSRLSIGVQSFAQKTLRALGRPERDGAAIEALERITAEPFHTNVDLVYGASGQSEVDWLADLETALGFSPAEIYLYPLYVRPATGLMRHAIADFDRRPALYAIGRDRLRAAGYTQRSMRSFVRGDIERDRETGYRCQRDGTIGLGPGARSYTSSLHYAGEWSVRAGPVRETIAAYIEDRSAPVATFGFELDRHERQRRYAIQSLLEEGGLDIGEHQRLFPRERDTLESMLLELVSLGLATISGPNVRLTDAGLSCSDVIGPFLYSSRVRTAMAEFEVR